MQNNFQDKIRKSQEAQASEHQAQGFKGIDGKDNARAADAIYGQDATAFYKANEEVKDRLRVNYTQPTDANIKEAWGNSKSLHDEFKDNQEVFSEVKEQWASHEANNSWPSNDIMQKQDSQEQSVFDQIRDEAQKDAQGASSIHDFNERAEQEFDAIDLNQWREDLMAKYENQSPEQLEESIQATKASYKEKKGEEMNLEQVVANIQEESQMGAYDGQMEQKERLTLSQRMEIRRSQRQGQSQSQSE